MSHVKHRRTPDGISGRRCGEHPPVCTFTHAGSHGEASRASGCHTRVFGVHRQMTDKGLIIQSYLNVTMETKLGSTGEQGQVRIHKVRRNFVKNPPSNRKQGNPVNHVALFSDRSQNHDPLTHTRLHTRTQTEQREGEIERGRQREGEGGWEREYIHWVTKATAALLRTKRLYWEAWPWTRGSLCDAATHAGRCSSIMRHFITERQPSGINRV